MKKKIFLIILLLIVILSISTGIGMIIFTKQREERVSLINDYIVIEYGETYNPSFEDLINLTEFNYIKPQDIKIESYLKNEEGKEYPSVGTYQIYVYYKKKVLIQNVEIKDTVPPELSVEEIIEIEKGTDLSSVNLKDHIKIFDLSTMKDHVVDFSNVDSNTSGEYIAKVSIEDIYGNSIEKEFKVVIPEVKEEKLEESNVQEKQTTGKNSTNDISKVLENPNNNNETSNNFSKDTEKNNSSINSSNSNDKEETKYCNEGGSKHLAGNGENEHGYYASPDLANQELRSYMKNFDSGNYGISECECGLYYFWVIQK